MAGVMDSFLMGRICTPLTFSSRSSLLWSNIHSTQNPLFLINIGSAMHPSVRQCLPSNRCSLLYR